MQVRPASPEQFVRSAARLVPVPLVSEIWLHRAEDVFGLWQQTEDEAGPGLPPPFWAFPWPGGQVLARHVLDHPGLVAGRKILDVGSGSGLVAIASQLAGAATVLASEIDAFAVAAIRLNARANGLPPPGIAGDVLDGDGEGAEVVLAADVWYSAELADRVLGLIGRATARGASVLVGDVGRKFLPRHRFRVVDSLDVPVVAQLEDHAVKHTMVLAPLHGQVRRG